MKYKLCQNIKMRENDLALFKFDTAELIKFNEKGFNLLKELLNSDIEIENFDSNEKVFLNNLIKANIITQI